jgi:phosphoribosylformylglycinamidine cyclo-ligase
MSEAPSEYARAGVNIKAGDKAKALMKQLVEATYDSSVIGAHGGFGGLYSLKKLTGTGKVLVGSADGVGTKLKLAFMTGKHDTIGHDLVNHLVNDILCCGARPLFFFDYLGLGKVNPETVTEIVKGLVEACRANKTVLLGGETAEMPGFYGEGEYDLAGFIVGIVDEDRIIDGSRIMAGDKIIGLASTGLHTNGYSLARRAFFDIAGMKPDDIIKETGTRIAAELLKIHCSYLETVYPMLEKGIVKGIAHITGSGFEGNIKRIVPDGVTAIVDSKKWPVPGVFRAIARIASVTDEEMYRVFNMGIGLALVCAAENVSRVFDHSRKSKVEAFEIGRCESGSEKVVIRF